MGWLRIVACPEPGGWSFHVINDSELPIDAVVLRAVHWEWGPASSMKAPHSVVRDLPPGGSAELWRGEDDEMRMSLEVSVTRAGQTDRLELEFGKLYLRRDHAETIPGFHRPGLLPR